METTYPPAEQAMLPTSALSSHDCSRPEPLAGPILVVVPHLRIGGAQKQAILLARKLKSSGHTVRIVLAGLERDRSGADYETLLELGGFVRNDVLKTGNRFIDSLFLSFARAIRKILGWSARGARRGRRLSRRWTGFGSLFKLPGKIFFDYLKILLNPLTRGFVVVVRATGRLLPQQVGDAVTSIIRTIRLQLSRLVVGSKKVLGGDWVRFREALQTLLISMRVGLARAVNTISESHLFRLFRSVHQSRLIPGVSLLPRRIRRTLNSLVQAYPEVVAPLSRKPSLVLRAYYLQRLLRSQQPAVVFSFLTQTNLATLIAAFGQRIPVVVSERNDVARQPISPHVAELRLVLYQGARVVTANGPHSVQAMGNLFPKQKVLLLPNGFPSELKKRTHRSKQLGMLCRLEPQKNVDLVIRAFHNSGLGAEGWALSIHGEGPEGKLLQTLIQDLSLQECVTLKGKTLDPARALDEMDFLISASDYEGSSNVIHEAVGEGVIPLFAHTVDEAQHILSEKCVSELMFHKSVNGLVEKFNGLDRLCDEYEVISGAVQVQFADYWDSEEEALSEVLFHGGLTRRPRPPVVPLRVV